MIDAFVRPGIEAMDGVEGGKRVVDNKMTERDRAEQAGQMGPGGRLIARLMLPDNPQAMDWAGLIAFLEPHVCGFLVDWDRFREPADGCPPRLRPYLELLLANLPPQRALLLRITCGNERETLRRLEHLDALLRAYPHYGSVFWVDTPLRYHSNRGLAALYQRLGRLTARPFLLENDPRQVEGFKRLGQRTNIRTHILKALAQQANIVGIIHYGSLQRSLNYSRAATRSRDFAVIDGDEVRFLDYPGKDGVVSFSANAFPSQWATVLAQFASPPRRIHPELLYDAVHTLRRAVEVIGQSPLAHLSFLLQRLGFLHEAPAIEQGPARVLDDLLNRSGDAI